MAWFPFARVENHPPRSIHRGDASQSSLSFKYDQGGNVVYDRILCAGKIVKRWKK